MSSGSQIGGGIGFVIGAIFGNPGLGQALGSFVGGTFDKAKVVTKEGQKIGENRITTSIEGVGIPRIYGKTRVSGNIIWGRAIEQNPTVTTETQGGKGGPGVEIQTTNYNPTKDFALLFADGTTVGITKIWANGELKFNHSLTADYASYVQSLSGFHRMRYYTGSETQSPDQLIVDNDVDSPAYLGYSYGVSEKFQLKEWGGLPNLEFEVVSSGSTGSSVITFDAVNQFGTGVLGSIGNDGLLILADYHATNPNRLYVVNPLTGATIETITPPTGYVPYNIHPPVRTANSVIVYVTGGKYAIQGATSTIELYGQTEATEPQLDQYNRVWGTCRTQTSPVPKWHMVLVLGNQSNEKFVPYFEIQHEANSCHYASEDQTFYISFASPLNETRQYTLGGAVLRVIEIIARNMCIAGDGSLWLIENSAEGDVYRVPVGSVTPIKVFDETTNNFSGIRRIARDWQTGDVLYANVTIKRYKADGTFVYTLVPATSIGAVAPMTNPLFPRYLFVFQTNPGLVTPSTQNVFAIKDNVITDGTYSIANALSAECALAGLTAGEIDVTAITGTISGFSFGKRSESRAPVEDIMQAYVIDAVEIDGKLKFVFRSQSVSVVIPEEDLGASTGESIDTLKVTLIQETQLPKEIVIKYINKDNDYQEGIEYARRTFGNARTAITIEVPLAFTPTEARKLAETYLAEAYTARTQYEFATTNKYTKYMPTNVVQVVHQGVTHTIRIVQKKEDEGLIFWTGVGYNQLDYVQVIPGGGTGTGQTTIDSLGQTQVKFIDGILYRDFDDDYGYYVAAAGYFSGWPGAGWWKSADGGATYTDTTVSLNSEAQIGLANSRLGDFSSGNIFDETNTVDVTVNRNTYESISELDALAGLGDYLIGEEVVAAKNAVLISTGNYRLSGLLRGRFGTSHQMRRHVIGEKVIKLSATTLKDVRLTSAEQNISRIYKAPTFGTTLAQAAAMTFTNTSARLKPRAPTKIGGGRNASNDIVGNFKRSARRGTAWTDFADVPLDESTESYEVDVFAGTALTITNISSAANGIITTSAAHGLIVGDFIYIHSVNGMGNAMNDRAYTVGTVPSTTTLTVGEDTAGYAVYTSAGNILKRKPSGTIAVVTETFTYTGAQQTTDYGSAQASTRVAIYQISARVGRGIAGTGTI